ncbi:NAD(P)/FAD-dependent oxidoreductase [Kitasatospora sp. NPDC127111]|uniref:NAD(P)/FAD-dependent oxidoreductase n=1 Tax=Kitasatospora sp. NPDC127111 TaxID=3345363 RepID=UPI00363C5042
MAARRTGGNGHYEVVVAGGGPAGAAAALTLARAGRRVLLADAGTGPPKVGEALPSVARVLLRDLGAGELPLADGHLACYANLSSWGSAALHGTDFIRDPNGPGWHLDRARFDRRLREAAAASGAEAAARTTVRPAARHPDGGWLVALRGPAGERTVRCDWLVDATGRRRAVVSACRATEAPATETPATEARATEARAGRGPITAGPPEGDPADRLLATCLELDPDPRGRPGESSSLVEAAADGWWYTTLLPGGRRLVAYFTDADLAPPELRTRDGFLRLMGTTGHIAARAAAHPHAGTGRPRRAPAHSARLDRSSGPGWTAVGDAVAAFDPVSSQGILTALHTGATGAAAVHAHLSGDAGALDAHHAGVAALLAAYRRNHHAVYAAEGRWSERPFWRRRRLLSPPPQKPRKEETA